MADSKLVVMLKLDGTDLGKGITKAQADISKLGVAFSGVSTAAGIAVKFAADFQDRTIKAARSAGVAAESFSAMAYAAGLSGTSTEDLGKSLVKLQRPSDLALRTFKDLGINAKTSTGALKDQSTLMTELAGKFENITDPVTKSQAAIRIFGEEGTKLVSLLEGGSKAFADARKEAYAFGQTVSEQAGKNAEQFNDNLTKVNMGLSGVRNVVSETVIEFVNQSKVIEGIQDVLKSVIESWRNLSKETKGTILNVAALAAGLGVLLLTLSGIAAVLPALASGFSLLTGPVGLVIGALALVTKWTSEYRQMTEQSTEKALMFAAAGGPVTQSLKLIADAYEYLFEKSRNLQAIDKGTQSLVDGATKALAEIEAARKKKITQPKLSEVVNVPEVTYKSEILSSILEVQKVRAQALGQSDKEINQLTESIKKQERAFTDVGTQASIQYAKIASSVASAASQAIKPFSDLTDTIAKGIEYDSQVAQRDLDVTARKAEEAYAAQREALESQEDAKIKALEDSYDSQINAIRDGENQKNLIAETAANERLLIANDEYQKARDALQLAYEMEMEQDRANYEAKMVELETRALDREQNQLTTDIMEEDRRLLQEQRERDHDARLAELAKQYSDKVKGIDDDLKGTQKANEQANKAEIEKLTNEKNTALTAAEEEKNNKLKALDTQRAAEEKAIEKERLENQYKAQMDAFNATKGVKIAETIASGLASAAQAYAALAPIPFVGPALGAAIAATILGVTTMRVGQIQSQAPIKPAGLLEDGGVIGGNIRHSDGGISANVESGEMFIDRGRTAKMFAAIDNGMASGGIQITFQPGSIQGDIRDERTITIIADKLGRMIQRQMVLA